MSAPVDVFVCHLTCDAPIKWHTHFTDPRWLSLTMDEARELKCVSVWLGSLGPLLWAVTRGDWDWAECLPKGWE